MKNSLPLKLVSAWDDYELLDSGNFRKLERFKEILITRPEPSALWNRCLSDKIWDSAEANFYEKNENTGEWKFANNFQNRPWICEYKSIKFIGKITSFKNVGYFPEKQPLWDYLIKYLSEFLGRAKVLNLFAYTGVTSIIAAYHGANITHVDASRTFINWAKANQAASSLRSDSVRWIEDDVVKFLQREVKRGKKYDMIMLDPPNFGRGTRNKTWEINRDLQNLLRTCKEILGRKMPCIILNSYCQDLPPSVTQKLCQEIFHEEVWQVSSGELHIAQKDGSTQIPQSTFCIIRYGKSFNQQDLEYII